MEAARTLNLSDGLRTWLASLEACPSEASWRDTRSWLADRSADALTWQAELLKLAVPDPSHAYGRTVLCNGPRVEVMVASWTPGRGCAPHDHGGSTGVVRILQGGATHLKYQLAGGDLVEEAREAVAAGGQLLVDPGLIHAMVPVDGATLVTLHLYADPIPSMAVFDCSSRRSLRVAGRSGAWIPEDTTLILEEVPGLVFPAGRR